MPLGVAAVILTILLVVAFALPSRHAQPAPRPGSVRRAPERLPGRDWRTLSQVRRLAVQQTTDLQDALVRCQGGGSSTAVVRIEALRACLRRPLGSSNTFSHLNASVVATLIPRVSEGPCRSALKTYTQALRLLGIQTAAALPLIGGSWPEARQTVARILAAAAELRVMTDVHSPLPACDPEGPGGAPA